MKVLPVRTCIIFDLETTDPQLCLHDGIHTEIWEIGACKVTRTGEILEEFSKTCRIERPRYFSPECEMLSNFRSDQLEFSPPFETVYEEFKEFCGRLPLMGWGVGDYQTFVQAVGEWEFRYPYFCALSVYAGLMAEGPVQITYSLRDACRYHELPDPPHRALQDARCANNVLKKALTYPESVIS